MRIHPVVNISRVKPYKERLDGQPTFRPGPVEVTEERDVEFEVDYIADSRWKGRRLEFLVHWQGYTEEDRTWEPESNLSNAKTAIDEFHNAHPNAPRRLRMTSFEFFNLFKHCGKPIPEVPENRLPFDRLDVD